MRRRGRHRKDGPRQDNGQPSRAGIYRQDPSNDYYASRHRILDIAVRRELARILTIPAFARTPQERDFVTIHHTKARNKHLGYPTGIAFERGLFRGQGSVDGSELKDAADIYAALHHLSWRDLASKVQQALEAKYGPEAFQLLLQVGRVMRPAPPNSHFEKLIGKTPPPPDYRTLDEIAKYRLSVSSRYGAASKALHDAGLAEKLIVDRVVIDGAEPSWVRSSPQPGSQAALDQRAFVAGLKAIADEFDLFAIRHERRGRESRDAAD